MLTPSGKTFFLKLYRRKGVVVGLLMIILFSVIALTAPVIVQHEPNFQSRTTKGDGGIYLPPAWSSYGKPGYWLGTDNLGRDIFSRVVYGTRISLVAGVIPMLITTLIGVFVGMCAGYYGGGIDNLLMRITDLIYSFPNLLFVLVMISALQNFRIGPSNISEILGGLPIIFIALSILAWGGTARLVRGQVISLRNKSFIEATYALGGSAIRIMTKHLLPNIMPSVIVNATFLVPYFVLTETFLSFVGIGIKPPTPTWGNMLNEGYKTIYSSPQEVWVPTLCISLLSLSFTLFGDGLRDILDPRLTHSPKNHIR